MEIIGNVVIEGSKDKPILLDIYYNATGRRKPVIIFSHGFKGFKDWGTFHSLATSMAQSGFVFVKFNFSHNGTTVDNPTDFADPAAFSENNYSLELDDLGKVIDWVTETGVIPGNECDTDKIYLMGHSRGGSISLLKAAEDPRVRKVVTLAATNNLAHKWTEAYLDEWKKKGVTMVENKRTGKKLPLKYQLVEDVENNKERLDMESAVKSLRIPVLVIHGTEDEAVGFEQSIEMKRWNKKFRLSLIPQGNHTFGGTHPWKGNLLPGDLRYAVDELVKFLRE